MKSLLAGGAIVAASFIGLGGAGTVAAQNAPYPPTINVNITLNLSITIINIGGTVNVSFIGCLVGETVRVDFNGGSTLTSCLGSGGGAARSLRAQTVGGVANASLTAPNTPGVYPVTATGLTSGFSATQQLTVVGAGAAAPDVPAAESPAAADAAAVTPAAADTASASLPSTGAESSQTLWIAGSALLAGLGLAGVGYRRRQHSAAA